jgi:hypothetical protein
MMRMMRSCVRWLVAAGVLSCAMTALASSAVAYEIGKPSPSLICLTGKHAIEVGVEHLPLEPANRATVPTGTPVVFSGKAILDNVPTFNVASSPALLSSPDIDSGMGSQSGAFYNFTSTKATATPRTIYWTASFTFTPNECETPSTFTTPVRTLIVAPSEAELASAKRQQEEAAAKKQLEEEAAARKKREEEATAVAATRIVLLAGYTITVQSNGEAAIKLACSGTGTCSGKLTLTAKGTSKQGRTAKTETIGTVIFSIPAGKTTTVKLELNAAGKTLLSADHGHLSASLRLPKSSPAPSQTHTDSVHLVQQKAFKANK